jgi:sirohydrochlorin cobalto/nickelchelatase
MRNVGILLVGHGSKKEYNTELITKTASLLSEKYPDFLVRTGFMWFTKPTITESLEAFVDDEIESIVILPLFLERGIHLDEDIPKILGLSSGQQKGTFKLKNREIPLVYANPIGPNPILADIMVENAQKALSLI